MCRIVSANTYSFSKLYYVAYCFVQKTLQMCTSPHQVTRFALCNSVPQAV